MRLLAVAIAVFVLPACSPTATEPARSLPAAAAACDVAAGPGVEISMDELAFVILEGGEIDFGNAMCMFGELGASDEVWLAVQETTGADGMQRGAWDGHEAAWQFDPSVGLAVIIRASS